MHEGNLITSILRPGIIYGLNNKINLSINTILGIRSMDFKGDNISAHHRNDNSTTDFENANGGVLGDSRITLNYLLKNTGAGDGYRVILGGGLSIPSKNTLIKTENNELSNLGYLDSLNDLLGIAGVTGKNEIVFLKVAFSRYGFCKIPLAPIFPLNFWAELVIG